MQEAVIRIYDAQAKGELSHFPVELTGGQVCVGDAYLNNEIPLPLRYNGRFELHLEPMWQSHNAVYFQGSGVDLELIGEPQYVEEFP